MPAVNACGIMKRFADQVLITPFYRSAVHLKQLGDMTNITPKGKKIAYLHLAANTPGHPDQAEAKARLAGAVAPVEMAMTLASAPTDSTNLKRFDRDGIELVIDTRTGEAFATQAGYARMSGIGVSGIGKRLAKLVSSDNIRKAEIDTGYGVKLVSLISANLVFKWAIADNPDLAEAMGTAGATVYLHQIAGFKVSSDAIASESAPMPTAPEQQKLGSNIDATIDALNPLKRLLTTVPDALVDGFLLNQVQKYHPEFKSVIDDAHTLLAANTPVSEILLTPTAIGERLGITARAVNTLLTGNGYQTKNPSKGKTEPAYLPTEKGKQHSTNTLATGRSSDNTTYQHIKWNESIVDELRELI